MTKLRLLFHVTVLICLSLSFLGVQSKPKKTPNILFIVVDDLNTTLGCYGKKEVFSPNIDRLAARGTRFDRAYCQYPLCNPSRTSFLSGRRPETSGVYVLTTSARTAMPDAVMLPQFFRNQGYFTAGAGKIFHSTKMNDAPSWDFYEDGTGNDPEEKAAIDARYGGGDGRPRAYPLSSDGSQMRDGVNTQTILKLMREQVAAQKPFFLAAGFHKPHLPWTAPKRFFDMYPKDKIKIPTEPKMTQVPTVALQTELSGFPQPDSRAEALQGYYACISYTDYQIGLLLNEMDKLALWENTVVVLVGDNGFHLGDHDGLWAKLSAFDASTHVPLLMAGAGVPKGSVVSAPVELLDMYPTLVALSGNVVPSGLEGKDLTPFLTGKKTPSSPASSIVFHYDSTKQIDIMGRTVIDKQWRYTEWDGGKAGRELYIRAKDPQEYHNRISDTPLSKFAQKGEAFLRAAKVPKAGEANRPRALLRPGMKMN